ncbi:hypothetical protein [Algiphilus sp.]|uniref:hypothetical protein n=1 Tax=Algiphilus sp. TaxID=1872431 RepID=UPI003C38C963
MRLVDWRVRSCLTVLALCLGGCGGGSGGTDGPTGPGPQPPGTGGSSVADLFDPTATPRERAHEAIAQYLGIVRDPRHAETCAQLDGATRCPPGARSGSPAGIAVHDWIARALDTLPAMRDVTSHPFDIPLFVPRAWGIEIGEGPERIAPASMPWYYSGRTPPDGVTGELVSVGPDWLLDGILRADVDGRIALVEGERLFNAERPALRNRLDSLADQGALGAVVYFPGGPANLVVSQNYDSREGLGDLPTLLVGKRDGAALEALDGRTARLVLDAEYRNGAQSVPAGAASRPAASSNGSAWLPGFDDSLWIVIGTPLNSWQLAAAERGPGIAVFLHLAQHLAERVERDGALPHPVYFVATGGHEIFQIGLQRFLGCWNPDRIGAYIHAGAALISRGHDTGPDGEPVPLDRAARTRTLSISENIPLRLIANPAFSDPALAPLFDFAPTLFKPGEAALAWEAGIPTVSLAGTNVYHHTAGDDESQILDRAIDPILGAYRTVVDQLLDGDLAGIRRAEIGGELRGPPSSDFPCAGVPAGIDSAAAD